MNKLIQKIAKAVAFAAEKSAVNSCREVSRDRMYQPKVPKLLLEQENRK